MQIHLKHQNLLNIAVSYEQLSYGGDQEWFAKTWHQRSGCGPTSASNITMYLAKTNPEKANLYPYLNISKEEFTSHMETLFTYVTPGPMGVNHVNMFINGLQEYAKEQDVAIQIESFIVDKKNKAQRDLDSLIKFTKTGLSNDCPIALLVLSRGDEVILQNWHWITITSLEIIDDKIIATASDEGEVRTFDLGLWYLTTKKHGGLVYIH